MQVQLVKNTPKTWKWLSLLVDFGMTANIEAGENIQINYLSQNANFN